MNALVMILNKGEFMIPIPVCVQIIVTAIVAGKEVLSDKKDK